MQVTTLGEPLYPSPLRYFVNDNLRLAEHVIHRPEEKRTENIEFELAGPRERLFFDAKTTRAGIVTCGGLSPGLNDVIRSLFLELHHAYGVSQVYGFQGGYKGLDPHLGKEPLLLTPELVDDVHKKGGTFLGTSRGPVDIAVAVQNLIDKKINILFVVGGDGTQRGGYELYKEAKRQNYPLAVVGVPKTIDNDIPFVSQTFGYLTAIEEAAKTLDRAHVEARCVNNGISLVKLMGRNAGFIAAGATLASQEVNFILVPEVPFKLEGPNGFLAALKKRIQDRGHALIVVAEGAGQELLDNNNTLRDASGNIILNDIGQYLSTRIKSFFDQEDIAVHLRYMDPSYLIRSTRANAVDSVLCDLFARNAVHAAMAGKTGLIIGKLHDKYIHVPSELMASRKRLMETDGMLWQGVLASTGQPASFY